MLGRFKSYQVMAEIIKADSKTAIFKPGSFDQQIKLNVNLSDGQPPFPVGSKLECLIIPLGVAFKRGDDGKKGVDTGIFGSFPKTVHGKILETFRQEDDIVALAIDAGFPCVVQIEEDDGVWEFQVGDWVSVSCGKESFVSHLDTGSDGKDADE